MKYIIIIFTTLVLNHLGISQDLKSVSDYYYQLYQGKQLLENGKPDSACIVFENAFKKVDYIQSYTIKRTVLKAAIESKNKNLVKKYRKVIKDKKKCPPKNMHILKIVDSLSKLDQKVRSNKIFKARQYYVKNVNDTLINTSKKFIKSKALYDNHVSIDSSNIICMLQLIDKYGYVGEQMLGYKNNYKARSILLHFDTDTNNTTLGPIFLDALKKNIITPITYAQTLDRHLYNTSGTQKYWMWFMIDEDPHLTSVDIKNIIRLRERIGLWGSQYKVTEYKGTYMLTVKTPFTL